MTVGHSSTQTMMDHLQRRCPMGWRLWSSGPTKDFAQMYRFSPMEKVALFSFIYYFQVILLYKKALMVYNVQLLDIISYLYSIPIR